MDKRPFYKKLASTSWFAHGLAVCAVAVYIIQSWIYAHTLRSNLDEGAYLYKGYLFVTGQYTLYQPYGPWSNHMPFAFLIPGAIQKLFSPGLATGRSFSVILAVFMLLGLWMLANRLRGKWWAAAALWVFALNPAIIKMYSTAVSQSLTAFLFMWILVLVIGENRPLWQIALGSILAGVILLTRINMFPVLPLVILYVFWQHGGKAGMTALISGLLVVVLVHAIFWPGIMYMWARLIPHSITPYLDAYRPHFVATGSWSPAALPYGKALGFFHAVRTHFVTFAGVIFSWILWPQRNVWKSRHESRVAIFLSIIFLTLLLLHMWATVLNDYCIYCLPGYLAFFPTVGLLLVILTIPIWCRQAAWWQQIVIVLVIIVISIGIGFGAFEDIDKGILNISIPRYLIKFPEPATGYVMLGDVIANKFLLSESILRRLNPSFTALLAGLVIIFIAFAIRKVFISMRKVISSDSVIDIPSFGYRTATLFLLAGTLFSPNQYLGGGKSTYDCGGDIIQEYRVAGETLAKTVPAGSQVYWQGGLSAAPLLYAPGLHIYPPQINDGFNYYIGGDADTLYRYGLWNEELSLKWLQEADYILIEKSSYRENVKEFIRTHSYVRVATTPPKETCRNNSEILIFKRTP